MTFVFNVYIQSKLLQRMPGKEGPGVKLIKDALYYHQQFFRLVVGRKV